MASENGNMDILGWYKNSGLEFKYTADAIDWASQNGHVNILNWLELRKSRCDCLAQPFREHMLTHMFSKQGTKIQD